MCGIAAFQYSSELYSTINDVSVFIIYFAVNILNTAIATSNLEGWMVKTYINEAETNSSVAGVR